VCLPHGDSPDWCNGFHPLFIRPTGVFFCTPHFFVGRPCEFIGVIASADRADGRPKRGLRMSASLQSRWTPLMRRTGAPGDTRMKTALLALVGVAATAVAFADDAQVKKDMKALTGTWQYTSQVEDGKDTDKEQLRAVTVTITADGKWEAKHEGKVFLEGTVKIDPSKMPKAADWKITTEGDLKGRTALGIYDVDKDTFKHCFGFDKRPGKFESKEGSKVTNAVLKRVKE
jgi:uncharacterized protein (TIGR03067 family)